ncbi:MAG: alpha/beta hydrolase-fold protein [Chloroflexota bacterium]
MLATRILVGLGISVLLLAGSLWLLWEQLPIRSIWPYLQKRPFVIEGEVQKVTFVGEHAGEQTYYVYLPKGYNNSDKRYRTLYHLHGAFMREAWTSRECNYIGAKMEEAAAVGIIEPMIIVCLVDPDGDRMWSDSYDGRYLTSTGFIQDLIPHVDETYRTVAARNGRALQGFSMGGFGTITNGFRAPELFSALIVWDGAIHNWQTLSTNRTSIASKMFAREAYFADWSPWTLTEKGAAVEIDLFMVVGEMAATRDFGNRFKPHLESTGRQFVYYDSPCPHSIFCMMDELSDKSFTFLANSFSRN